VVRWPGGCFADRYHWRDGIGPAASRLGDSTAGASAPSRTLRNTRVHEFCRLVGLSPTWPQRGCGTVEEFQQWVEYCNAPAGSTTLQTTRGNGALIVKVRFWA